MNSVPNRTEPADRVQSDSEASNAGAAAAFDFCVIGNTRTYLDITAGLTASMAGLRPAFAFNMGNAVNEADNDNEWLLLKRVSWPLTGVCRYYGVPGTVDRSSRGLKDFFRPEGTRSYYSFVEGRAGFIVVDSAGLKASGEQMAWLEAEARNMSTRVFRFLFLNQPVVWSGEPEGGTLKELLDPVLKENRFDIVFSGFVPDYERWDRDGIRFVVTGGGGAPLLQVRDSTTNVDAGGGSGDTGSGDTGSGDTGSGDAGSGDTGSGDTGAGGEKGIVRSSYHYCSVAITNSRLSFTARSADGKVIDSFVIEK